MIATRVFGIMGWVAAAAFGSGCGATCLDRDEGESVLTSCVSRVELQQEATGFPRPPDGSACSGERHYIVDLQARTIEWTTCLDRSSSEPWAEDSGRRTLTAGELDDLVSALGMLSVSGDGDRCGFDKPTRSVRLFGEGEALTYYDSFYRCRKPAPHVDNIDSAFELAQQLSQTQ